MADLDHVVAGLTCREVLADLSEFVDGTLPAARVDQLRAHVAGCHVCESFGGRFAALIERLRTTAPPPPLPPELAEQIRRRLDALGDTTG